jgi:hypothetical protein
MIHLVVNWEGDERQSKVRSDERFMTYSTQVSPSLHSIATETLGARNRLSHLRGKTLNDIKSSLEGKSKILNNSCLVFLSFYFTVCVFVYLGKKILLLNVPYI